MPTLCEQQLGFSLLPVYGQRGRWVEFPGSHEAQRISFCATCCLLGDRWRIPRCRAHLGNSGVSPGGLNFAFGNGASVGVRKGSGWEAAAPRRQKTSCRAGPRLKQAEGSWADPLAVLRDQEQAAQKTELSLQEQMPYLEDELCLLKDQGSAN